MEGNYLTSGDLALIENRRGYGYGYGDGYGCHKGSRGMAATGIGLAAGLGGGALLLAIAGIWGVNQASKARSRGNESAIAQQNKTMEVLSGVLARETTRNDGITLDVQQTLRNLTGATAQGGSATALSNAEALALALNNNSGLGSAIGGCNYLRVARVSGSRLCGCDNSCDE